MRSDAWSKRPSPIRVLHTRKPRSRRRSRTGRGASSRSDAARGHLAPSKCRRSAKPPSLARRRTGRRGGAYIYHNGHRLCSAVLPGSPPPMTGASTWAPTTHVFASSRHASTCSASFAGVPDRTPTSPAREACRPGPVRRTDAEIVGGPTNTPKSHCITRSATCPNLHGSPTDSAEEALICALCYDFTMGNRCTFVLTLYISVVSGACTSEPAPCTTPPSGKFLCGQSVTLKVSDPARCVDRSDPYHRVGN